MFGYPTQKKMGEEQLKNEILITENNDEDIIKVDEDNLFVL